jgi:hypothetical protein
MEALTGIFVTSSVATETAVVSVSASASSSTVVVAGLPAQGPGERLGVDFRTSGEAPESGEDVDRFWPWLDDGRDDSADRHGKDPAEPTTIEWRLPAIEPAAPADRHVVSITPRRGQAGPVATAGTLLDGFAPRPRGHAAVLVDAVLLSAGDAPLDSPNADELARALLTPHRRDSGRAGLVLALAGLGALALVHGLELPRRHPEPPPPRRRIRPRPGSRAGAGPRGIIR